MRTFAIITIAGIMLSTTGYAAADDIRLSTSHPRIIQMRGSQSDDRRHLKQVRLEVAPTIELPSPQEQIQQDTQIKQIGRQILAARRRPEQTDEEKQLREKVTALRKALITHKQTLHLNSPLGNVNSIDGKPFQQSKPKAALESSAVVRQALNQVRAAREHARQRTPQKTPAAASLQQLNEHLNLIEAEIDEIMSDTSPQKAEKLQQLIDRLEIKQRPVKTNPEGPSFRTLSSKKEDTPIPLRR